MSEDERAIADDVRRCFLHYEAALIAQDHDALDKWFWDDARVVRFGISEIQYGAQAVAQWRRGSPHVGDDRALRNVHVLVLSADVAVVSTEFVRDDDRRLGRQTQVWARIDGHWRVAHAHVSSVDSATCAVTGDPSRVDQ